MADNDSATSLDYWRKFFQTANTDIFQVIKHAILVASADCPTEFFTQLKKIIESLFPCRLNQCSCDQAKVLTPEGAVEEEGGNEGAQKESKESNENNELSTRPEDLNLFVSKYSNGDAAALLDEIEEDRTVHEVMRIKGVLAHWQEESEKVLFESLRRLQLMELSVETLHATAIERAVSDLQEHSSKQNRLVAETLIKDWRLHIDKWEIPATASQETTSDSADPSPAKQEDWLHFPSLDEGALRAIQTESFKISAILDELDDDGNPRSSGEFEKNEKPQLENINLVRKEDGEMRRQEAVIRPPKLVKADQRPPKPQDTPSWLVPGRPSLQAFDPKSSADRRNQKRQEPAEVPSWPSPSIQNVSIPPEESSYRDKIARRKLQERYQETENAKKQRTIQMVELKDLPKQGHTQRQPKKKHGSRVPKMRSLHDIL